MADPATLGRAKTIRVRDLRDNCAQIIREVASGETFTVTEDGRPVAGITPYIDPQGPQTWVPAHRAIGALAHLDLPADVAERLRTDIDESFEDDTGDPFERWERLQADLKREGEQSAGE